MDQERPTQETEKETVEIVYMPPNIQAIFAALVERVKAEKRLAAENTPTSNPNPSTTEDSPTDAGSDRTVS